MPRPSPIEQARRWWKEHADAGRYVVSPALAPSASAGLGAIKHHLGDFSPPDELLAYQSANQSERVPFFRTIEQAQVDGDAMPFTRFVWHAVQQSATDLLDKQRGSQPARRTRRPKPRVAK
jgi:hypothetical protein